MSILWPIKEVGMNLKKIIACALSVTFLTTVFFPAPSFAEYVYNADLGKFVKTDTAIYDTAAEQFDHARELEESGDLKKAEDAYSYVYRKFPDSSLAQESILALGAVQEKLKKYNKAVQTYQKIIELYPQSQYTDEVLERQYKIGNLFLSGVKGKFLNLAILPSLPQAIKVFTQVTENGPFSEYGRKGQFQLGLAHKKKGDMTEAISAFQKYIDNYPTAELVSEAYFQIAEIAYRRSMRRNNDRKLFQEATTALRDFLRRYPNTADTERINQMLVNLANRDAQSIYDIAMYYEQASYLDSAIVYYKDVVAQYPQTQWADKARKRLKTFEDPEKFLAEGQAMLDERLEQLRQEKESLAEKASDSPVVDDKVRAIEERISEVKDDIKRLEKEKKNEVRIRWESYRRKKWELAEKKKKLKDKEKTLSKRPSPDLEAAISRWRDSLLAEEYALKREEQELVLLEKKLGIKNFFGLRNLFRRSTLGFGSVTDYKANTIAKIKASLDDLETRKNELFAVLKEHDAKIANRIAAQKSLYTEVDSGSVKEEVTALAVERDKLAMLKARLDETKSRLKEKKSFGAAFISLPRALLKPFKRTSQEDPRQEINDLRLELRGLKDAVAHEKNRIERLEELEDSFSAARQKTKPDEKSPAGSDMKRAATQERIDKRLVRKEVMALEKKINEAKQIVEDGLKKRNALIAQLDMTIDEINKERDRFGVRFVKGLLSPFVFLYKGLHTFMFGFKDIETRVEEKTSAVDRKAAASVSREVYEDIKARIQQLETTIAQAEEDIRGYERALKALMIDLKSQLHAKDPLSDTDSVRAIQAEIAERKAYIAAAEKEITDKESELIQREDEFRRIQAEQGSLSAKGDEALEAKTGDAIKKQQLERRVQQLETDLALQKKIVRKHEELLREKRRGMATQASQKTIEAREAKILKRIDDFKEEKEKVKEDLRVILDEQEAELTTYAEIVQAKLERIKKHMTVMGQYQDRALADMKETQKTTYKELDQVNSYKKRIDQERLALAKEK
jgi:outer membrane protein assembly factor BamD